MPRYLTRTELKKQRLEETRAKYPITFETAFAKLYGRDDVAEAFSIAPRKSLTELAQQKKFLEDD
jgi:hypothetical protein